MTIKPPPRDATTRVADTRDRLERDADAWIASAGPEGPWLVPLSPLWDGERIWFMHNEASPTTSNVRADQRVRVAFGPTRDVVLIDGTAEVRPSADLADALLTSWQERHGGDPRSWAEVTIVVRPERIQAWREENELSGRTIMRDGHWLA